MRKKPNADITPGVHKIGLQKQTRFVGKLGETDGGGGERDKRDKSKTKTSDKSDATDKHRGKSDSDPVSRPGAAEPRRPAEGFVRQLTVFFLLGTFFCYFLE